MSKQAVVMVRFEEPDDFDPNDPGDTACARTAVSRGFSQARKDDLIADAEAEQISRLKIVIASVMNGGKSYSQSADGGHAAGQLTATVETGFEEQGIPFSEGAWCREFVRSICWYPSPTEWPKLAPPVDDWGTVDVLLNDDGTLTIDPDGSFAEALAAATEEFNEGKDDDECEEEEEDESLLLSVSGSGISIAWPEDLRDYITPDYYRVVVTDSMGIPEGKEPPILICEGPIFTNDTETNPYLKDGPGITATGDHGTRLEIAYGIYGEGVNASLEDGFVEIRGSMVDGVSAGNAKHSISAEDLQEHITEPGEYKLKLKTEYMYGRIEFRAFGMCLKSQRDYCGEYLNKLIASLCRRPPPKCPEDRDTEDDTRMCEEYVRGLIEKGGTEGASSVQEEAPNVDGTGKAVDEFDCPYRDDCLPPDDPEVDVFFPKHDCFNKTYVDQSAAMQRGGGTFGLGLGGDGGTKTFLTLNVIEGGYIGGYVGFYTEYTTNGDTHMAAGGWRFTEDSRYYSKVGPYGYYESATREFTGSLEHWGINVGSRPETRGVYHTQSSQEAYDKYTLTYRESGSSDRNTVNLTDDADYPNSLTAPSVIVGGLTAPPDLSWNSDYKDKPGYSSHRFHKWVIKTIYDDSGYYYHTPVAVYRHQEENSEDSED